MTSKPGSPVPLSKPGSPVPLSKPGSPVPLQVTLRHDVHTLIHTYFTNLRDIKIKEELEKRNHLRVRLEVFFKKTLGSLSF